MTSSAAQAHGSTVPPVSRRAALSASGLGIAAIVLPSAASSASVDSSVQQLGCAEPSFQPIPFVAEGDSVTVGDVTITATENSAIDSASQSFTADGYIHAEGPKTGRPGEYDAGTTTTLTFSPGLTELQVTTVAHADGANAGVVEIYTLTGLTAAGTTLFTETISNENTTRTLPSSGEFAAGLRELRIVYSGTGTPTFQYASIIYLRMLGCAAT
jgi:hypothetical protein